MDYNIFKSKTFWSAVALFVVSGTNGIMGLIPEWSVIYVQGLLTLMVSYFHLQTAKNFGAKN